jgi:NTP pyrophosphatase (non-canonical NTP hydrolase)
MMRRIYFLRDAARGAVGTYDWLVEEVEELGEALKESDNAALENELADVIAWLASLANVLDLDLEKAALTKYDGRCPKCGEIPCECSPSK